MPKKIRKRHKSPQCRGLLEVKNTELWTECCPLPSEMKGWPWVPGMRDNSDPPSPHPTQLVGGKRRLRQFQRDPGASKKETTTVFSGLQGKHANTTNQTAPERNTITTSPHTTDNDGSARSPCSRWRWACAAQESFHSTASMRYFPTCNLSQMNSCCLGQSGPGNTFPKRI